MITVELNAVPDGKQDYQAVAELTVADDGTYQLQDPDCRFPVDLPVLVPAEAGQFRKVRLEEDPATWARHLDTVLRTGYLVPVVTRDDEAAEDLENTD